MSVHEAIIMIARPGPMNLYCIPPTWYALSWLGSAGAIAGGLYAQAHAPPDSGAAQTGLVGVVSGLVLAFSPFVLGWLKQRADIAKAENDRKTRDHGLKNKLATANFLIASQATQISELQIQLIANERLLNKLAADSPRASIVPLPPGPVERRLPGGSGIDIPTLDAGGGGMGP